jgi:O-antigen/teichoic acid export membrane protein
MRFHRRLLDFAGRSELRKAVLTMAGGTAVAQALVAASSPLLTRLYSPADFGTYSAVFAISISLLIIISTLSYQSAIALPDDDTLAANVLGACIASTVVVSFITLAVLLVAGDWVSDVLGTTSISYVLLLVAAQATGAVGSALMMWALRKKSFSLIARNSVTVSGSQVAAQLALGVAGLGALGLMIGFVVGSLAGSIRLGFAAWKRNAEAFRRVSPKGVRQAARRYRRFAILTTPASLLNALGLRLPLILLIAMFGPEVTGQFALADRVIALPIALLAGAAGNAYFAQAAPLAREPSLALRGLFLRTTRSLALVAIGPVALTILLGPLLFGFIFGEEWTQAGVFAAIMAPWYGLILVTNPTSGTLGVLERQDLHLVREVLRVGVIGAAPLIAFTLHASPEGVVASMSLAGCVTYLLYGWLSWRAIVTRRLPQPAGEG